MLQSSIQEINGDKKCFNILTHEIADKQKTLEEQKKLFMTKYTNYMVRWKLMRTLVKFCLKIIKFS